MTPDMTIQAIIETAIYVDDLDVTERFYRDIFDLRVIAKEPGRHVFFQVGTSSVAMEDEVAWPAGGKSVYFRDPAGNSVELVTPGVWGLPSGW
jgi:catechol 2,3-dioxygenase-like lactoylglutathione lyase family enzyme